MSLPQLRIALPPQAAWPGADEDAASGAGKSSPSTQATPTARKQQRGSSTYERAAVSYSGPTPRQSAHGSIAAQSENVNLLLMLDDSGVGAAAGSPRLRVSAARSQHSVSYSGGGGSPSLFGARPSGALDIKRAIFHRYFEPDIPAYGLSGRPHLTSSGAPIALAPPSQRASYAGNTTNMSRMGSLHASGSQPPHASIEQYQELDMYSPGLKSMKDPRPRLPARPPPPDYLAHITPSTSVAEHLRGLQRLLANIQGGAASLDASGPRSPQHVRSLYVHGEPTRTGRAAALHMAHKGFLAEVAGSMVSVPALAATSCELLAAAGEIAPGVLDGCVQALVRTLPLPLGGGSGGEQPAVAVRASSAYCTTDFYNSLRGGAVGMTTSISTPRGTWALPGSPGAQAGAPANPVKSPAPCSPGMASALAEEAAARQPPSVRAAALRLVLQLARTREGRAAVMSAPHIRRLVAAHLMAAEGELRVAAAAVLLQLARSVSGAADLAGHGELGVMCKAAVAAAKRVGVHRARQGGEEEEEEEEGGDWNMAQDMAFASTLLSALALCAQVQAGTQRMAVHKQLPAAVAKLLAASGGNGKLPGCVRPALRLLDTMASHPQSETRTRVRNALEEADGALQALTAMLKAPGHNVCDCAAALNLLWVAVLGDDTRKAQLLSARPPDKAPSLAALVMHKVSAVYTAAVASADGRVQDDGVEGVEGEGVGDGEDGAAGDDVSAAGRSGHDQMGQVPASAVPGRLLALQRVESESDLMEEKATASPNEAQDTVRDDGGLAHLSGRSGQAFKLSKDADPRSTSFEDMPTPFASQPAAQALTMASDDGGPVAAISAGGAGGRGAVAYQQHSVDSISGSDSNGVQPKMVMWSMDAAVVELPALPAAASAGGMVEQLTPRYATPGQVAALLRCGLGLTACLLSCLASKPDAAKPLVSPLTSFVATTLKPLVTTLSPEQQQQPAGRLCTPELRHWALVVLTNLCASPYTAPLAARHQLLRLAADSVRHGLGMGLAGSVDVKKGGLHTPVRRAGGVAVDAEFVVPAARALAAYLRTTKSTTDTMAVADDMDDPCGVSAACVMQLASEALTVVLSPRLAAIAAAQEVPATTRDVAFTGEPAVQPIRAGPSWPAQELHVVHALAAALTYAARGTPSAAMSHAAASEAAAQLCVMLVQLLPHIWGERGVAKACPEGADAACQAATSALTTLLACGHIAPDPVCAILMRTVAAAVATPNRVLGQPLLAVLHDVCRAPSCASMVVRDTTVMSALIALYRRVQKHGAEGAGSSVAELQGLFLKLRPHDRYGALRTVTLPKPKRGAEGEAGGDAEKTAASFAAGAASVKVGLTAAEQQPPKEQDQAHGDDEET